MSLLEFIVHNLCAVSIFLLLQYKTMIKFGNKDGVSDVKN